MSRAPEAARYCQDNGLSKSLSHNCNQAVLRPELLRESVMPLQTEATTFTKDVQGRYICSTWEEATSNPEAIDAVILGGGMYGGYCGAKVFDLSAERFGGDRSALRVLVLDAGPYLVPGHTQNIPDLGFYDPAGEGPVDVGPGSNPGIRREVWGVGWRSNERFVGQAYCVGGKGIFWGGWCPRLQAADLQSWPTDVREFLTTVNADRPVGLRPLSHRDLVTGTLLKQGEPLTGYEAAEYELGVVPVDDFVFDPAQEAGPGPQKVGLNQALRVFLDKRRATTDPNITQVLPAPIAVQTQSYISGLFALDKYSSVPALISATRRDHGDGRADDLRMTLVPNCHVIRLGFRTDSEAPERGTRVINRIDVNVNGRNRSLFLAPHCQVVLAMSAIESTRLALESFSLVDSGLRAANDELMGRNYMIHLRADVRFSIDRAQFAKWVKAEWPGFELADVLQLAALHIQCEGKLGRYQYQLYAATNSDGPDRDMYRLVPDLSIQRQIADRLQSKNISFVLRGSCEVPGGRKSPYRDPNFDFIDLASDFDADRAFGHRRAWVQFNGGNHTGAPIWQDLLNTVRRIATVLNDGDLPDDKSLNELDKQGVGTTFHDAGTLWMGESPDESVTDANGHFHHVTNAYCCDQALFTTIGSANPVLTGVALARKVAGDIVDRHSGYSGPMTLQNLTRLSLSKNAGWKALPYEGMSDFDSDNAGFLETNPFRGIGLYYLAETYGDFDLAIEWKSFRTYQGNDVIANSGLLLRMPDPVGVDFSDGAQFDTFYNSTTEVQIDETGKRFDKSSGRSVFGDSRYKTGALYGVAPASQWAANVASPDGPNLGSRYWNTFEVSARGKAVRVILNGKVICNADVPAPKRLSGYIGLQFHTGRVQFRNLRLHKIS